MFKALVGSYNYNLNTKNSDKDYKMFVLPTFLNKTKDGDEKMKMNLLRIINIINKFSDTDFNNFEYAIRYNDDERLILLNIKNGFLMITKSLKILLNRI